MGVGRKPKLTVVKQIEGDRSHAGKAALGDKIVPIGKLTMPARLKADEAQLWAFVAASLPKGLLCRADTSILERFVIAWNRYRKCDDEIKVDGLTVKTPQGLIRHPLLGLQKDLAREMHACGAELGLSPVARERLSASSLKEDDPMGWLMDE